MQQKQQVFAKAEDKQVILLRLTFRFMDDTTQSFAIEWRLEGGEMTSNARYKCENLKTTQSGLQSSFEQEQELKGR